jgi:putative FmdB family regulatory protein
MPTYDYRCDRCENRFERVQKFSDSPVKTCPKCRGPVKRVVHATGIVFKGSGFYINDSRKAASKSSESESVPKVEAASKADLTSKSESPKPTAVSEK